MIDLDALPAFSDELPNDWYQAMKAELRASRKVVEAAQGFLLDGSWGARLRAALDELEAL